MPANVIPKQTIPKTKLTLLAEMEGKELNTMLDDSTVDGQASGICMNEGCEYCNVVAPDEVKGYCPECDEGTVQSCLVIAGG